MVTVAQGIVKAIKGLKMANNHSTKLVLLKHFSKVYPHIELGSYFKCSSCSLQILVLLHFIRTTGLPMITE
jgi:hypothetical protein